MTLISLDDTIEVVKWVNTTLHWLRFTPNPPEPTFDGLISNHCWRAAEQKSVKAVVRVSAWL